MKLKQIPNSAIEHSHQVSQPEHVSREKFPQTHSFNESLAFELEVAFQFFSVQWCACAESLIISGKIRIILLQQEIQVRLGVEDTEAIFLNDFRSSSESIARKELPLLLEGQTVHLPNMYARDICINRDTPIFATGKAEIKYTSSHT